MGVEGLNLPSVEFGGAWQPGRMIVNERNAECQNKQWINTVIGKGFDSVSFSEAMMEGIYFYSCLKIDDHNGGNFKRKKRS